MEFLIIKILLFCLLGLITSFFLFGFLKSKGAAKVVCLLTMLNIAIIFANFYIHFTNGAIQGWFRFSSILTFIFLTIAYCVLRWGPRSLILPSILVVIIFMSPLGFTILMASSGLAGTEEIQTIPLEDFHLTVYQTNCGATCAFGLEIKKEKWFFFDVLKTGKEIAYYYPGNDITFEKIEANRVKIADLNIDTTERQQAKEIPQIGDIWDISQL